MMKNKTSKKAVGEIPDFSCASVKMTKLIQDNMHDYGIEVVQDRALQDFRDGLKPAQRHLLQAMCDLKAWPTSKFLKSARVTGDTMGKYHPHSSTYSALVNMVNENVPVVEGQGNFGTLTSGYAAERYTEVRISKVGMKMFECSPVMETVPNYTGEFQEPVVFPSRLPYYFVNGGSGIAVGLSCCMPAHNLSEVVSALKYVVRKGENASVKGILKRMPGPDYKYGGFVLSSFDDILSVYKKGCGSIRYSCEYRFESLAKGVKIVIDGYCPGFSPSLFLSSMVDLVENGIIVSAQDVSERTKKDTLEVVVKSTVIFDRYIKKHLEKSVSYNFYALERSKIYEEDSEKDVHVEVKTPNILELMQSWVAWRRTVEMQMLSIDLKNARLALFRHRLRLDASENIDIVLAAVKQDKKTPEKYLIDNLPILRKLVKKNLLDKAESGAAFIGAQPVFSLKKADRSKMKEQIGETIDAIEKIKNDMASIDDVVVKNLDALSAFFTPRKLKFKSAADVSDKVSPTLPTFPSLRDYSLCGITEDGKKERIEFSSRKLIRSDWAAFALHSVFICNREGLTKSCSVFDFQEKEKNWKTSGICSDDCCRLLYLTSRSRINVIDVGSNDAPGVFSAVKLKEGEEVISMIGIYPGTDLVFVSGTGIVKVISADSFASVRKNSFSKSSGVGFKKIRKIIPCHRGCRLLSRSGALLSPKDPNVKSAPVVGMVGSKNFVVLHNGEGRLCNYEEVSALKGIKFIVPLKFSGRFTILEKK